MSTPTPHRMASVRRRFPLAILAAVALLLACEAPENARESPPVSGGGAHTTDASDSAPTSVEVDGQWRAASRLQAGESCDWTVDVPPDGRVALGVAMHPDAWVLRHDGLLVRLSVDPNDGTSPDARVVAEQWICPRDVPDHRGWIDLDVDLKSWVDQRVRLRLSCTTRLPSRGILGTNEGRRGESLLVTPPRLYSGTDARDNVLVVVIDTLRRDALHCYGNPREVSPRLDAFAADSARFTQARATSPWTHPSTASLLSGWTPWQHGLGMGPAGTTHLDARTPMIARDFQRAGFATAAISGNRIVSPDEGFGRGFDHFDTRAFENEQSHSAQRVTRGALQWIESHRRQPFFAYLHYFDPHDRYQAPRPFTRRFVEPRLEAARVSGFVRQGAVNPLREGLEEGFADLKVRPEEVEYLRALYDGEVAYVDHWVGRLFDQLDEWGLLDRTLVVVTSDHGEEFYDHGFFKHGHSLHDELVAVPLMIRMPRAGRPAEGRTLRTPVSLLDLAPTLRDLASLPLPSAQRRRSWRSLLQGGPPPDSSVLVLANHSRAGGAWAGRQRGLVRWPYKWIESREPDRVQLFDLERDPRERTDLAAQFPGLVDELEALCTRSFAPSGAAPPPEGPVDLERLEKLKALGYAH